MPNPDNKEKVRQGFTFFRSFRDAVAMTAPNEQLVLYKAIADYALDQIEPDVSTLGSLGRLCWTAIRPNIESGLIRFFATAAWAVRQKATVMRVKQPKNKPETTGKQPTPF